MRQNSSSMKKISSSACRPAERVDSSLRIFSSSMRIFSSSMKKNSSSVPEPPSGSIPHRSSRNPHRPEVLIAQIPHFGNIHSSSAESSPAWCPVSSPPVPQSPAAPAETAVACRPDAEDEQKPASRLCRDHNPLVRELWRNPFLNPFRRLLERKVRLQKNWKPLPSLGNIDV